MTDKSKYEAGLDLGSIFSAGDDIHADHTGWAWDPQSNVFVLTLHREDDSLLAVACYTYENWMDCFDRLQSAKQAMELTIPSNDNELG
jgi:hypothetical protein